MARVLAVVDVVFEEHLLHAEEGLTGEKRVGSGLMLGSDALDLELIGHLLETALEVLGALHEVLDVVHVGEIKFQDLEELALGLGQRLVGEELEEVSEIVAAVKRQPLDGLHEHEPGGQHHLGKERGVDAFLLMLLELDARGLEQLHRVLGIHILGQVELEVELPRRRTLHGQMAFLVLKGQTQLDNLKQVHIATQKLILIIRC